MAARQGLSAQISQASEDAKRAVLQRAPLKSSWFSNLNTTCTIKSAPPRTPEVLTLLGTKCGWLIKRNEQHMWQSRWCCVVPHTFLYYFDADIGVGTEGAPSAPPPEVQQALNQAVRDGFRGGNTAPRSSLYNVFPSNATPSADGGSGVPPEMSSNMDEKFNTLTPAGIIDLECYSSVHRSSQNNTILELAGDDSVNPDLRSFYFCASSEKESEEWTQAFLSMRHQALVDEREAFREVCDGFAQQLQQLHTDMEEARMKQDEATEECYRVRSASEEQRRNSLRVIQEALERTDTTDQPFGNARRAYRSDLETVRQQNMGVLPAVKLLSDYTLALENNVKDLHQENHQLRDQLRRTSDTDQQEAQELRKMMQHQQEQWQNEKRQLQHQVSTLQQKLQQSQKQVKVAQHEATTQRGDFKSQITTLTSHKKILKKEVLTSRQKLKELLGELDKLKHYAKSAKMDLEQERRKAGLLQRYIDKMEAQVQVQQNMMQVMSASVAGSVRGDDSSFFPTMDTSPRQNMVVIDDFDKDKTPPSRRIAQKREDGPSPESPRHSRREDENKRKEMELMQKAQEIVNMDDDKSHVSELTEDRTQRQFDAVYRTAAYAEPEQLPSLLGKSSRPMIQSPPGIGPPSYIGVEAPEIMSSSPQQQQPRQSQHPKLDTINNLSSASLGGLPARSNNNLTRNQSAHTRNSSTGSWTVDSNGSLVSTSQKRLSVAQRARLEAERKTSTVRVGSANGRVRGSPRRSRSPAASLASQGSFFTKLENKIVAAIDNSVLGVPDDLLEDAMESGEESVEETSSDEERMMASSTDRSSHTRSEENKRQQENVRSPTRSERWKKLADEGKALSPRKEEPSSPSPPLTLEQRQAMQRARQLEFLKNRGLVKDDSSLRGGAGASRSDAGGSNVSIDSSTFARSFFGVGSRSYK